MVPSPERPCDVVGCGEQPNGTYLDSSDTRQRQFLVCDRHMQRLRDGARPSIVAARLDLGQLYERPALQIDEQEQATPRA
jgi:hypothetical protein